jgi:hypothetical protein
VLTYIFMQRFKIAARMTLATGTIFCVMLFCGALLQPNRTPERKKLNWDLFKKAFMLGGMVPSVKVDVRT